MTAPLPERRLVTRETVALVILHGLLAGRSGDCPVTGDPELAVEMADEFLSLLEEQNLRP